VTDAVTERVGLRTIALKDNRFYLNGREVQFRGVNKHAQNEYVWNAVSDEDLRLEWQWMADMGVNMVRLPHYPHSHLEYDIADERGIVVWAENGYAGQIWKDPGNEEKTITPDGERLTREMVRQNWNHPSILFWSAGNETILDVVSHYATVIRQEEDPTRLVTYAATADQKPKNCDFIAYNPYDGWYTSGPIPISPNRRTMIWFPRPDRVTGSPTTFRTARSSLRLINTSLRNTRRCSPSIGSRPFAAMMSKIAPCSYGGTSASSTT